MAVILKNGVFVVSGKRIPFGKYGGLLRDKSPSDMFATAAKAAIEASKVEPGLIDTVNIGQISSLSKSGMEPRHAALKAGVPQEVPVLGMNKLSGSSFQSAILSAQEITIGSAEISLTGGMENLSNVPFVARNLRFGHALGSEVDLEDMNIAGLFDTYCNMSLTQTGDLLAKKCGVTREEVDAYAFRSQMLYKAGNEKGIFDSELTPITVKFKGENVLMNKDETPNPNTTLEQLSKLSPLYKGSVNTAGNSCGLNDGAAAMILAGEEAVYRHNLKPLARIAGWACVGVEPEIMGIGLAESVKKLLDVAGFKADDIDLYELHETSAAIVVSGMKILGVDEDKVNCNGGGIAVGHPPGASGARIIMHLAYELKRRGLRRAIGAVCAAGGQGVAVLVEAV